MPSAPQTLAGSQGTRFLADTTVQVATLMAYGGEIWNNGPDDIWIAEGQNTIAIDGSDPNSIRLQPAQSTFQTNPSTLQSVPMSGTGVYPLNPSTTKFAFRANILTANVTYVPPRSKQ